MMMNHNQSKTDVRPSKHFKPGDRRSCAFGIRPSICENHPNNHSFRLKHRGRPFNTTRTHAPLRQLMRCSLFFSFYAIIILWPELVRQKCHDGSSTRYGEQKNCAISHPRLNEGICMREYSKFRPIEHISFKSFQCLLESSLIVETHRRTHIIDSNEIIEMSTKVHSTNTTRTHAL